MPTNTSSLRVPRILGCDVVEGAWDGLVNGHLIIHAMGLNVSLLNHFRAIRRLAEEQLARLSHCVYYLIRY